MSVILVDEATDRDFPVNGWNWGVLHALVERSGVLPTARWAPARSPGCGGWLEPRDVRVLVHVLAGVLEQLGPGDRIDHDLEITGAPREPDLRPDAPQNDCLERPVLEAIVGFLRAAGGAVPIL